MYSKISLRVRSANEISQEDKSLGSNRERRTRGTITEEVLRAVAKRDLTKDELRAQRVSAVMSGLPNYPSSEVERDAKRQEIRRILDRHIG